MIRFVFQDRHGPVELFEEKKPDHLVAECQFGQSQLFVLSVRTRRPLSAYGAMFDSLKADNVIRRWFLMEGTDTVPCVFVQQEATGELVPGIDLLLGFDIRTSSRDQRILFRGAGLFPHDLYFDYDRSSLRELNDRLPAELKDPEDPRRT